MPQPTIAEILAGINASVTAKSSGDVLYPAGLHAESKQRPFQITGLTDHVDFRKKAAYRLTITFKAGDTATLQMGTAKRVAEFVQAFLTHKDVMAKGWYLIDRVTTEKPPFYTWAVKQA